MYKVSTLPVASSRTYALQPMYDNEAELEDHDNDGSYSTLSTGIHFDDLNTSGLANNYIHALHKISDKSEKVNELIESYKAIFREHKGAEAKEDRKQKLKLWVKNAASHVPPKPPKSPAPPKLIDEIERLVKVQTNKEVQEKLNEFVTEFQSLKDKHDKQKWGKKVRKYCKLKKIVLHTTVHHKTTMDFAHFSVVVHNNKINIHKRKDHQHGNFTTKTTTHGLEISFAHDHTHHRGSVHS